MAKRTPAFARAFAGGGGGSPRWTNGKTLTFLSRRTSRSSERTTARWSSEPSKRTSTCGKAPVMAPPTPSSRGRAPTITPTPAVAAGRHSAPPAASSATCLSTRAMIQASSPNASDFFNNLLDAVRQRAGRRRLVRAPAQAEGEHQQRHAEDQGVGAYPPGQHQGAHNRPQDQQEAPDHRDDAAERHQPPAMREVEAAGGGAQHRAADDRPGRPSAARRRRSSRPERGRRSR